MELHDIPHKISYRDIKYPRLEFTSGELLFVLPFSSQPEILFEKHKKWIQKKLVFLEECLKESAKKESARRTKEEFKALVNQLAQQASQKLGVKLNHVFYKKMKTKWASCSVRRNLTINTLAQFLPEGLFEYIIFHEMAHLKQKKHNARFWEIVSKKHENHQELERELFIYWFRLCQAASRCASRIGA